MQRLQRESIFKFGHSDESSRIDSNTQRCVTIHCDGKKERHPSRAWEVSSWAEKHALFQQSQVLNDYLTLPNFKVPSPSTFYKYYCKCLRNPTSQSCVDIIKSRLYHYRKAIACELRTNSSLIERIRACSCPLHLREKSKQFTSHLTMPLERFIYYSTCKLIPIPLCSI